MKIPDMASHRILSQKVLSLLAAADQYAGGVKSGAEALLTELRATLRLGSDQAVLRTDVKNAFGAAMRASAMREVLKLPQLKCLAPYLASMWLCPTEVWLRGPAGWVCLLVQDGLYQGDVWSGLLFCLIVAAVQGRVVLCTAQMGARRLLCFQTMSH